MFTPFKDIPVGYYFRNFNGDVFKKTSKATFRVLGKEILVRTSVRSSQSYFVLGEDIPVHLMSK